jgi:RNA polymerase sigma-70 factor, ECF subfamily
MDKLDARRLFDEQLIRSQRHIFRYIAALLPDRDEAEEVFQNTCLKLLEKADDFRPEHPMLPWACGIAQNMVRKHFERNRRRGVQLSEVMIAAVSETQQRSSGEINRRLEQLPGCLQALSAEERALLEQCYSQHGAIRSVAEAKHISPDTVYKRLERIRRRLFECIEQALTKE